MKGFLVDENLPDAAHFPCSLPIVHARDLGPMASDTELWWHAAENALAIVTKDADFADRILATDPPPWVIHIRVGNLKRRDFVDFVASVWLKVEALLPEYSLIQVFSDRIEGAGS